MTMTKMKATSPVRLTIDTAPGQASLVYNLAPGDECEVPSEYVESGYIYKLAKGLKLVELVDVPGVNQASEEFNKHTHPTGEGPSAPPEPVADVETSAAPSPKGKKSKGTKKNR